jgi:hypothetical protein
MTFCLVVIRNMSYIFLFNIFISFGVIKHFIYVLELMLKELSRFLQTVSNVSVSVPPLYEFSMLRIKFNTYDKIDTKPIYKVVS